MISTLKTAFIVFLLTAAGFQENEIFHAGPVITTFGNIADVESDVKLPPSTIFKIRFDVGKISKSQSINSTFESAARFINVNVAAGVPRENIRIAIVVHGSAAFDVTKHSFYERKKGKTNSSTAAVQRLQKHQVEFYLCGQSAAYHGINKSDLLNGVKLAPSAMTIHALLDQQKYSLNPF